MLIKEWWQEVEISRVHGKQGPRKVKVATLAGNSAKQTARAPDPSLMIYFPVDRISVSCEGRCMLGLDLYVGLASNSLFFVG